MIFRWKNQDKLKFNCRDKDKVKDKNKDSNCKDKDKDKYNSCTHGKKVPPSWPLNSKLQSK
jgi:hypothetical protein